MFLVNVVIIFVSYILSLSVILSVRTYNVYIYIRECILYRSETRVFQSFKIRRNWIFEFLDLCKEKYLLFFFLIYRITFSKTMISRITKSLAQIQRDTCLYFPEVQKRNLQSAVSRRQTSFIPLNIREEETTFATFAKVFAAVQVFLPRTSTAFNSRRGEKSLARIFWCSAKKGSKHRV